MQKIMRRLSEMSGGSKENQLRVEFDNPNYNEKSIEDDETEDERRIREENEALEKQMSKAEKQFLDLMRLEKASKIDIYELNLSRYVPNVLRNKHKAGDKAVLSTIKLGSLEGYVKNDDEFFLDLATDMEDPETCTEALMNYFYILGQPGNTDNIDIRFLDLLCTHADVTIKDRYGQSLLHEVAREWSVGIANYMMVRGVDLNSEDNWGRTPLFVAVASNYPDMVEWLVKNGADLNHRTMKGEEQLPIHYAAKHDAVDVFDLLLELGADPLARDANGKTPFFLAAETANANMCKYLLDMEIPTSSYTKNGESTIDQIIENLPTHLTRRALDQFIFEKRSGITAKISIYLSCLGKRRWRLLSNQKVHNELAPRMPPDPLQRIIRRNDMSLINHPVILELIKLKAMMYGDYWIRMDIILSILFTVIWTSCASIRVNEFDSYDDDDRPGTETTRIVVLVLAIIAQFLTVLYIYKFYKEWKGIRNAEEIERERIECDYEKYLPYCHPRWVSDITMIEKRVEAAKTMPMQFWSGESVFTELTCLAASSIFFVLTVVWFIFEYINYVSVLRKVRLIYAAVFVMIVFIRLNRCFQSFQSLGPFINMIGESVIAGIQIMFLFFEFFVPFSVAFWVFFGGTLIQTNEEYQTFQNMLYQIWLLSFVGDYEYDPLFSVNPAIAQALIGLYFVLVSIITINIYIALLSEAFARVNETACEKAYLAQARFIQNIEVTMPETKRSSENYMNKYCAPKIMTTEEYYSMYKSDDENPRGMLKDILRTIDGVTEDTQKIISTEILMTKEIESIVHKVHDLNKTYSDKAIREAIGHISSLFTQQNRPLTKAVAKANNKIYSIINKGRLNLGL